MKCSQSAVAEAPHFCPGLGIGQHCLLRRQAVLVGKNRSRRVAKVGEGGSTCCCATGVSLTTVPLVCILLLCCQRPSRNTSHSESLAAQHSASAMHKAALVEATEKGDRQQEVWHRLQPGLWPEAQGRESQQKPPCVSGFNHTDIAVGTRALPR